MEEVTVSEQELVRKGMVRIAVSVYDLDLKPLADLGWKVFSAFRG